MIIIIFAWFKVLKNLLLFSGFYISYLLFLQFPPVFLFLLLFSEFLIFYLLFLQYSPVFQFLRLFSEFYFLPPVSLVSSSVPVSSYCLVDFIFLTSRFSSFSRFSYCLLKFIYFTSCFSNFLLFSCFSCCSSRFSCSLRLFC